MSLVARAASSVASCLVALLLAASALADSASSTKISLPKGPGSIEGLATADVSPALATGTASYSIPIAVPPGSAGFGPSLSLSYDSGGAVTELGFGWRVGGVPKIRRRTEDGLPKWDASDTFELVGLGIPSELLEVSEGTYRPRYEDGSFVRVSRSSDGATWEARTKSGITFRFGGDGFTESEGNHASAYLLREQIDRHGHRVLYSWDVSEGHALLTRVVWNDFDVTARNELTLSYEIRSDPYTLYSSGIRETLTRRLAKIDVDHGSAPVRRYVIGYGNEAHPMLRTLDLVGRDGVTTMPAARFGYTEAKLLATAAQVVTMTDAPGRSPSSPNSALADLDGDGLPDLLVGQAGAYRTYRNKDGKGWRTPEDWAVGDSPSVSLGSTGVQLADVDADGAPDLLVKSGTDSFRYFPRPTGVRFDAAVPIATVPSFTFEDPTVRLADLDGDRRVDVIMTTPAGVAIGYNRGGTDWTEPTLVGRVDAKQALTFADGHTDLCDVNGDRVQDFCYLRSTGLSYWLGRGRGVFEAAEEAENVPAFDPSAPFRLEDLNGDGWVDLVRVDVNAVSYALATAEGVFGPVQTIEGTPTKGSSTVVQIADMNGSGTADIVWVDVTETDSASWRYLELFPDGKAGLLRTIDNGLGKVQSIDYRPASVDAAAARDAGKPWATRLNVAMPVVGKVTVDSSLGDPARVVEYTYRDGVYDPNERTVAGFASGVEREVGDDSTPTLVTETTFDVGLVNRALRGAPLVREVRDDAGAVFSRTTLGYTPRAVATAIDGRAVEYAFKSSEREEHVEGRSPETTRTVFTEFSEDDYGNVLEERRWGEISGTDNLVGNDESLVTRTFANDPSEWLLGYVATEEVRDAAGKRAALSRKFYDGAPFRGLAAGQVTRGDLTREEAWVGPADDAFELVLGTEYDDDGHPIETKDAKGGGHVFAWAPDHTALRSERVKLERGPGLSEVADIDGASGNLSSATEYNGQTTHYEYDVFGRLTKVIRPGDSSARPTVSYSYVVGAPLSRVITESRVRAGEDEVEHSESVQDGLGRVRGTLTRDGDRWVLAGVSIFDARGNARRSLLPRWVDSSGRDAPPLLDGTSRGSDVWHDALGREVRTRSPSGIEARSEYWPLETRHWDGAQNDPTSPYEHTPTVTRKDGLGRVVQHSQTLSGSLLSASYEYDAAGELTARTDPEGNVARYQYDGRGRRVSVADPDVGAHTFAYDATNNLVAHRYPDGATAKFTFDLAGRSLTEDHDGDGKPEVVRTWDVDSGHADDLLSRGKLVRVADPSGETVHEYDFRSRIAKTTLSIDGAQYTVKSAFDDQDREALHTFPDGSSVEIHRNPRGQVSGYGRALEIDYDGDGLEIERRFSSGVNVLSGYDEDRRRSDLKIQAGDGDVVEHLNFTYDPAGNLTKTDDRRPGVTATEDRSETYGYDNLYRLSSAAGRWGHTTWRYSPSGSLLGRDSDVAGQSVSVVHYEGLPHAPSAFDDRKIAYDARGRMTTDGERTYTWDDADELSRVSSTHGTVENIFDGDGTRRVRVETNADGTTSKTVFIDPWSEVKDGRLVRYIVHGGQRVVRLAAGSGAASAAGASWFTTVVGALSAAFVATSGNAAGSALAIVLLLALVSRLGQRTRTALRIVAVPFLVALGACACSGEKFRDGSESHGTVQELSSEDTLLATDLLGSLLGETTASGKSTSRFAAYPFGATRFDTSKATQKYAGAPRDGAVDLDAMGARFYAPDLGVWTTGDPLAVTAPERLVTADFAGANPYAYAKDSPTLASDRDGHFWQVAIGAAIGALIGGGVEAGRQYMATGHVEDWGRIASAAAGGAVSGIIMSINPGAALGGALALGGASNAAAGVTERLIASGGRSAGTLKEAVVDAGVGVVTAGVLRGGGALVRAAVGRAPGAASGAGRVLGSRGAAMISTPHGVAVQETSALAKTALAEARGGSTVYRQGAFGVQETAGGQFWSPTNPASTPGYAAEMGLPGGATPAVDWIMGGTLKDGADAISRSAPGIGVNVGGQVEIVVKPGSVGGLWFHMP